MDLVWVVGSWIADTFTDPVRFLMLVAGIAALPVFAIGARVAQIRARAESAPADDLL